MSMFPEANIKHLVHSTSDHCPLLITTIKEEYMNKRETFKFQAWWVFEETFEAKVKRIWDTASGLRRWAIRIGISRRRKKEILTLKLFKLMEAEMTDDNLVELLDTKE
ncbi:reverse transcriptase [Gossypium australe]|uniref:Reverse transcriptase n=1 Tax=Gossypium australe TaxID=47621 RepID=A0A5B6VTN6_9ROSI|nr:reverse transcriptase [Gossypium australe]